MYFLLHLPTAVLLLTGNLKDKEVQELFIFCARKIALDGFKSFSMYHLKKDRNTERVYLT